MNIGGCQRSTRQLLQLVGTDVARWWDLAELFPRLSPEHRDEFLSTLRARAEAPASGGDLEEFCRALIIRLASARYSGCTLLEVVMLEPEVGMAVPISWWRSEVAGTW